MAASCPIKTLAVAPAGEALLHVLFSHLDQMTVQGARGDIHESSEQKCDGDHVRK